MSRPGLNARSGSNRVQLTGMNGRDIGADIVVVGGGAAGCVVARRTAKSSGGRVLLVEAGPDLRRDVSPELRDGWRLPTLPDWGYEAEPEGSAAPRKLRRGRALGGTSWLTRFAVRGAAADFDGWAASGNEGWAFADVLPAFRRLEADAEFGGDAWHGDRGPIPISRYPALERSTIHEAALEAFAGRGYPVVADHNSPEAVGVGPMPMSSRNGDRVTSVDAYLPADLHLNDLDIRCDTAVARVLIEGGRARGVLLSDGTEVRADQVILSAGTYGSPTILMRSGIGPADHLRDVGVESHLDLPGVGSNLADHPGVDFDSGWRGPSMPGPSLHSIATYRSSSAGATGGPDLMFWLSDPTDAESALYLDPILLRPKSRGTVPATFARSGRPAPDHAPGHQPSRRPGAAGRGAAARDRASRRASSAADHLNSNDTIVHARGPARIRDRERLLHPARRRHLSDGSIAGPWRRRRRAGSRPRVDDLRVIDASIIPEPPSGFPHVITIMIAERLTVG